MNEKGHTTMQTIEHGQRGEAVEMTAAERELPSPRTPLPDDLLVEGLSHVITGAQSGLRLNPTHPISTSLYPTPSQPPYTQVRMYRVVEGNQIGPHGTLPPDLGLGRSTAGFPVTRSHREGRVNVAAPAAVGVTR